MMMSAVAVVHHQLGHPAQCVHHQVIVFGERGPSDRLGVVVHGLAALLRRCVDVASEECDASQQFVGQVVGVDVVHNAQGLVGAVAQHHHRRHPQSDFGCRVGFGGVSERGGKDVEGGQIFAGPQVGVADGHHLRGRYAGAFAGGGGDARVECRRHVVGQGGDAQECGSHGGCQACSPRVFGWCWVHGCLRILGFFWSSGGDACGLSGLCRY